MTLLIVNDLGYKHQRFTYEVVNHPVCVYTRARTHTHIYTRTRLGKDKHQEIAYVLYSVLSAISIIQLLNVTILLMGYAGNAIRR
jgi:hypothetical protein